MCDAQSAGQWYDGPAKKKFLLFCIYTVCIFIYFYQSGSAVCLLSLATGKVRVLKLNIQNPCKWMTKQNKKFASVRNFSPDIC